MDQRDNINTEEVDKFNDLANEWWNPYGSFAPLHKLNPLRFEYIRANSNLEGKTAIEKQKKSSAVEEIKPLSEQILTEVK